MKDNTGIKESCPLIDSVITFIKENINDADVRIDDALYDLEEIRNKNKELRDLGNQKIDALSEIYSIAYKEC